MSEISELECCMHDSWTPEAVTEATAGFDGFVGCGGREDCWIREQVGLGDDAWLARMRMYVCRCMRMNVGFPLWEYGFHP